MSPDIVPKDRASIRGHKRFPLSIGLPIEGQTLG